MTIGHNSKYVTDDDMHKVKDWLIQYPSLISQAKRNATRTEWLAKLVLAELVNRTEGKSHGEREAKAIVQDIYQKAVEVMQDAEAQETQVKAQFAANELICSLFQTQSANERGR